jgi:polysaccharide deacetylase family protein (PEP-CTERM system associated)
MMPSAPAILITIDVEEWFQVENLRPWFPQDQWDFQNSRVESATKRLLDLFDSFDNSVRVTFFVLGWVAQRHPKLVAHIKERGHEIASHGYNHLLNYQLNREALKEDLSKSKQLLEDITGEPVAGYRAPCFSIDKDILKAVQDAGYQYDSSYNSFAGNGRYGAIDISGMYQRGMALQVSAKFIELPISNIITMGQTIPWGGGGYFRLIPPVFFRSGVRHILNKEKAYMLYLHPWEFDPAQPKVPHIRNLPRFRHYLNIAKTHKRLRELILTFRQCRFMTCSQYIHSLQTC